MYSCSRGFALITALVVLSLVTTVSVSMAVAQRHSIELTTGMLRSDQLRQHANAVLLWADGQLKKDLEQNNIDTETDTWNQPLQDIVIDNGRVNAVISDLQGKFNLNNLVQSGTNGIVARQRFQRLLKHLAIETDVTDAIADWLDQNNEVRLPLGAEDDYYLALDVPYRSANQAFTSPSELLLVKGVTRDIYMKLAPFITTLPPGTPININTAPLEILLTLSDTMDRNGAEALMALRERSPFTTVDYSNSRGNNRNEAAANEQTAATSQPGNTNPTSAPAPVSSNSRQLLDRSQFNDIDANRAYNKWTWSALRKQQQPAQAPPSATASTAPAQANSVGADAQQANDSPVIPQNAFAASPLVIDYQIDTTALSVNSNFFRVDSELEQVGHYLNVAYVMQRLAATDEIAMLYKSFSGDGDE